MEKSEEEIFEPTWYKGLPEYDCDDKPCIYPCCRTETDKKCCFTGKDTP